MSSNRRSFLVGAPVALLGIPQLAELAAAQSSAEVAHGVADFWTRRMGVPSRNLLRAGSASAPESRPSASPGVEQLSAPLNPPPRRGSIELGSSQPIISGTAASAGVTGFGREPLFFYLDEDEHALVPAVEVPRQKLHPSGDTMLDLQMDRLRLSPGDAMQFRRFASGGIYLDMQQQQHQQPQQSNSQVITALASSLLSAIFPVTAAGATKGKSSAPAAATSATPAAGIALQQTAQAQSIGLPNGVGKLAFSCFMKDRRKSAFGTFVSAFLEMGANPAALLPAHAVTADRRRARAHRDPNAGRQSAIAGRRSQWIMGSGPVDVSSTADASSNVPGGLRLRSGTLVAIPQANNPTWYETN